MPPSAVKVAPAATLVVWAVATGCFFGPILPLPPTRIVPPFFGPLAFSFAVLSRMTVWPVTTILPESAVMLPETSASPPATSSTRPFRVAVPVAWI